MLQYIIDAYEQRNKKEGFLKSKKNMNIFYNISLYLIMAELVVAFVLLILNNYSVCFCFVILVIVTLLVYLFISTRLRRKNWHVNIKQYNMTLDVLKEILCERDIKYYSKNKIKILIHKCEYSINEIVLDKEKSKLEIINFVEKFIIPIVAFTIGIMSDELKNEDMLYICVTGIIIIVLINLSIKGISYILEDIEGNKVEERKYMRDKLQDLLIRDFEVDDKDLYVNE